jgi:CRISPR-associated endoribonuclease Cas6
MALLAELNIITSDRINLYAMGGKAAHGFFLKMVQDYNPSAAEELHRSRPIKPFTLSVQAPLVRSGATVSIPEDEQFRLRITILDEALEETVFASILKRLESNTTHLFAGIPVRASAITDRTPVLERMSPGTIIERIHDEENIPVQFLTPTAFRRVQDQFLYPDPEWVFASVLEKWNAFSPVPLPQPEDDTFRRTRISRYNLRTRMLRFKGFNQLGFTGSVVYNLARLAYEEKILVSVLSHYATWSGVGAKTTMGMGVCRRVDHLET